MNTRAPRRPGREFSRTTLIRFGSVLVFWVVMVGWLIRFEACPQNFTGRFDGYRDLFKSGTLIQSSWMKILVKGSPIGFSHTEIDVDEKSPSEHYRIDSEMELELNILQVPQRVYTRLFVTLDILSHLQRFTFTLLAKSYETKITGFRIEGDRFRISIHAGGVSSHRIMSIPDDVILYSPMLEQALGSLEPGQTRIFKTLDPASMAISDVKVRADRRETITIRNRQEEATVLAAD